MSLSMLLNVMERVPWANWRYLRAYYWSEGGLVAERSTGFAGQEWAGEQSCACCLLLPRRRLSIRTTAGSGPPIALHSACFVTNTITDVLAPCDLESSFGASRDFVLLALSTSARVLALHAPASLERLLSSVDAQSAITSLTK